MTNVTDIMRCDKPSEEEPYLPTGIIQIWKGNKHSVPKGWLPLLGQWVKCKKYKELYKVIGNTYSPQVYRKSYRKFLWFRIPKYEKCDITKEVGLFRLPDLRARFDNTAKLIKK